MPANLENSAVATELEKVRFHSNPKKRQCQRMLKLPHNCTRLPCLEPDILECEVKWALESITTHKASGGDGIPVELLKNLKENVIKVLHSVCQQTWKTQQWSQDWKRSILIPIPRKGSTKECANHWTTPLISHASKVMLKILHARL